MTVQWSKYFLYHSCFGLTAWTGTDCKSLD